jgi:hypothetical protein
MASKFVIFSFAVTICLFNLSLLVDSNALDDYVNQYDPHTSYTLLDKYRFDNYTIYILNFTSQKWLDGLLFLFNDFKVVLFLII